MVPAAISLSPASRATLAPERSAARIDACRLVAQHAVDAAELHAADLVGARLLEVDDELEGHDPPSGLSNSQCIAQILRNPTTEVVAGPGGERLQNNAQRARPGASTWAGPKLCDELQALVLRGLREQLADRGWLINFTVGASCEEDLDS